MRAMSVLGRAALVFALLAGLLGPALGQVVINEISAANSDRLLRRDEPGYPRLGVTPPWFAAQYSDERWSSGKGPFGFGVFSNVTFGVNLSTAMQGKYRTLYVRRAFDVASPQAFATNRLELVTRYNDGFIAFLNGVEVARRNMGSPGMFAYRDQFAFNTNTPHTAAETISLGLASNLLCAGSNLLCIQTHNKALTGNDGNNFLSQADLRVGGAAPVPLVYGTNLWRYFIGQIEPSGGLVDYGLLGGVPETAVWATLGFNDADWPSGPGPFGYDRNVPVHYTLGTSLSGQMYGLAASVYVRTLFSATEAEAASVAPLQLEIDYDDAIIVYLNGREVARRNVGVANTITPFNTLAPAGHGANGEGGLTNRAETIALGAANTLLAGGDNVLCLQIHNSALTSSDLIGRATLSTTGAGARILSRPESEGRYFVGIREPTDQENVDDSDVQEDAPDSEGDWVELYNPGAAAANLTGWSLTDDAGKPRKWYFPANSTVPAGGYLLVMCTGFDVGPANGTTYLHTSFKLGQEGEYLGLVNASGAVVSELAPAYPRQSAFHTYARTEAGAYVYCASATPGAANTGLVFSAMTAPPEFSVTGGFYNAAVQLELASPDPAASIRYTLDGREPAAATGLAYAGALTVPSNAVVRARCFKAGEVPSATRTHTYLIAQSDARRSIPAICVNGDPELTLYGPNATNGPPGGQGIMAIKGGGYIAGIWSHKDDKTAFNVPLLTGRSSEKPASLEYFPTNGAPLRTDFGLRISSSPYSRPRLVLSDAPSARFYPADPTKKPSFNFFFRGEMGESPLNYPLFPESTVSTFEDVRLRAGKNDIQNPFIRDELMRRIYAGTGQQSSVGTIATLYINGVYKGYFNFCEHLREAFMQAHHNSSAAWDVRQVGEVVSGDAIHWNSMLSYLRTNDLTKVSAYLGVHDFLDVDNVIDYLLVNIYGATWDWPNNNYVTARERSAAGRWRFYMWDAEGAFGLNTTRTNSTYDIFLGDTNSDGIPEASEAAYKLDIGAAAKTSGYYIPSIYTLLKASPEFRLRFADRAQKHFFHEGCLTRAKMESLFFVLRDQANPIMKDTISVSMNTSFYTNWIATSVRRDTTFFQLAKYGLWPSALAPEFSQHGGSVPPDTAVSITNLNASGSIYFTTNGVDPRAAGGGIAGTLYTGPVRFPVTATLKARVLTAGGEWSPLQEALFLVPVAFPVFLPVGSADWTADANWSSAPLAYPCGAGVSVFLNAPGTADRDVNLRAPVTIGSVTVVQNDTPFRNKLRDRSSGNVLTFQGTNGPAALVVNGWGTGFVELEVEAGTVLASDLRLEVNSTAGNAEYGALRLRSVWSGSGGLIKDGVGVATLTGDGKNYTGPTLVRQGVLALTQPSVPLLSPSVTVTAGGQLRLTSASTLGAPRYYAFGCPLTLSSLGRGGALPASGQGVLGGLRYQPESDGSEAVISNTVTCAGLAGLHVEGSRNRLVLAGPLAGSGGFVKTGSGNLLLTADNRYFAAPFIVSNGTVTVSGRVGSAVELAPSGVLTGTGRTGPLSGSGTVALDKCALAAPYAQGLQYAFAFSVTGSPDYASCTNSRNGVLRLLAMRPGSAPSVISVYLDRPEVLAGDRLRGGLYVESGEGLAASLAAAEARIFVPDVNGLQTFAGRTYSPYAGGLPVTLTCMPETADFGDGPRHGCVMEVRVGGEPVSYEEWRRRYYPSAEELADATVSGPEADPFGYGVPNLLKYAFGMRSGELVWEKMPGFLLEDGVPVYRFRFDPGKNDLAYRVEASADLRVWGRVLFDSRSDWPASWDGTYLTLADPESGPPNTPRQFYRLRVLLVEP